MEQKMYFQNAKGDRLCGILNNPSGDTVKLMVILCHGFSSSKNTANFLKIVQRLTHYGISSFRFDIFGHGESDGKFEDVTVSEAVDDIMQSIRFLKAKGYTKLGLLGSSFGGIASIIAASKTGDLLFLVLKSPVSNYEEKERMTKSKEELDSWKKNGYRYYENSKGKKLRINYSLFKDFKHNDGYKAAPNIHIPTLIVHGDADEVVPVSQSIKTASLIPDCKLVLIKGANHRYSQEKHAKEMLEAIMKFIMSRDLRESFCTERSEVLEPNFKTVSSSR